MRRHNQPGVILRLARIVVSMAMLAVTTLFLTGMTGRLAVTLGWAARVQFVPLLLAGSVTGLVVWVAVTALLGRIYCSTVCPLGAAQDVIARLPRMSRRSRNRHPYHYAEARTPLRVTILCIAAVCLIAGIAAVPALVDPYSIYGRWVTELLRPVVQLFGGIRITVISAWAALVAVLTLGAVGVMAWRRGRLWCNTVCPVGAALGLVSRYSLMHFDIDTDVCISCRRCEHACKAQCIDVDSHTVDSSRCVVCFDCTAACQENAISYTLRHKRLAMPMMQRIGRASASATVKPAPDAAVKPTADDCGPRLISRRQFMATGLIIAATPLLSISAGDSREAACRRPVAPPGHRSMRHFLETCTACGACSAHCPTGVLRPSLNEYGWTHTLQPLMRFSHGVYCDWGCVACTTVCPTGALEALTPEEKHIYIIGQAHVDPALCIGCGRCSWSCPRQAIAMVDRPGASASSPGRPRPVALVDPALCIGCGRCQAVCPVTPVTAIAVSGLS